MRVFLRIMLVLTCALALQATSCVFPGVFVIREYAFAIAPDSSFALPQEFASPDGRFEDARRTHWWSPEASPPPVCPGARVYRRAHGQGPYWFDMLLRTDTTPSITIAYAYRVPANLADSTTPKGMAQRAKIAVQDSLMMVWADEVIHSVTAPHGQATHVIRTIRRTASNGVPNNAMNPADTAPQPFGLAVADSICKAPI